MKPIASRHMRRLLIALASLAVIDPFVGGVLRRAEHVHYESDRLFRFEASDLFALGPLVEYLNEHPTGDRPRAVFFGNSVVWGYFLTPSEALPAQFQRLVPDVRVLNLAINGFETGSAYLITKQIIDEVDVLYIFDAGRSADPVLAKLIDVDAVDLDRFHLRPPDRVEQWMDERLSFWRLYHYSHRLQAAFFGTSTRVYLYLHKADIARALLAALRGSSASEQAGGEPATVAQGFTLKAPVASAAPGEDRLRVLARRHRLLWDYANVVRDHRKRAVFVQRPNQPGELTDDERADLNAHFQPHVIFSVMEADRSLFLDQVHLSARGAVAAAAALRNLNVHRDGVDR